MNVNNLQQQLQTYINQYQSQLVALGGGIIVGGLLMWFVGLTPVEAPTQSQSVDEATVATATSTSATSTATTPTEVDPVVPVESEPVPSVVSVPVVTPPSPPVAPAAEPVVVAEVQEVYEVTAAHRAALLASHNNARAAVGVGSLAWSAVVAQSAQAWADVLAARGCGLTHSTGSGFGENLAYAWTSRDSAPLDPAYAVRRWVAERADYDYDSNTCEPGAVCGHYTQVVWADSTQLGCGVSVCTDDGFIQLWVCQYNPPGNWIGEQPY